MFWIGLLVVIALALVFAEEIAAAAILAGLGLVAWLAWSVLSQWMLGLLLFAAMLAVGMAIVHIVNKVKARISVPPGQPR